MEESIQIDEYDSPWKEAIDTYFEEFMAFFFPEAHKDIDWSRGYETLDTELKQVVRDANLGKRLADKLVKVWLHNGKQAVVLVHIEIQGQYESGFSQRMWIYHYRICDRYLDENTEVVSLAILGDDNNWWRPKNHKYSRWGCKLNFQFPVVKLLDYRENWSALRESRNPFAIMVMAYLKTKETRDNASERFTSKLSIIRGLYDGGYTKEQILQLFRLVDWMMTLPKELRSRFDNEVSSIEEEKKMPYITSIERLGIERGIKQGIEQGIKQGIEQGIEQESLRSKRESIIEVLEIRFAEIPSELTAVINGIEDFELLKQLHKRAVTVASVEELQQLIPQNDGEN